MSHWRGSYAIYTRATTADAWAEDTALRLPEPGVVERQAEQPSTLPILQTYHPGTEDGSYRNLTHYWVLIRHVQYDTGTESDLWYGWLEDQTLVEAQGVVRWTAVSVEDLLSKVTCADSWAEPTGNDGVCTPITLRAANEDLDTARQRGLRGATEYHLTRDGTYCTAGSGDDAAYVFGTSAAWNAYEWLRHLVHGHCPPGGSRHCPVGIVVTPTPAAQTALEAVQETWDVLGQPIDRVVTYLCHAAGDLAWHLDWSVSGDYGYDRLRLRIWSRSWADRDGTTQTAHTITTGEQPIEALDSRVTVRVRDRPTAVVARGGRIRVQFSVSYDARQNTDGRPRYERGWTDSDESAWDPTADDAADARFEHVYRRLLLPPDQTLGDGSSPWQIVMQPEPSRYSSVVGDLAPAAGGNDGLYAYPRALLPVNLTRAGVSYTSQSGDTPLSANASGVEGVPDPHPILCWWRPDSMPTGHRLVAIPGARPLDNNCGVMLPPGYRGDGQGEINLTNTAGSLVNWKELLLTVSVELDVRIAWTASRTWSLNDGTPDDQRRVLVVDVPEARWDVALPDTIVGWSGGTPDTVDGVLRNDLPVLKAAAEDARTRLSEAAWHGDVAWADVKPEVTLGDFLESYAGLPLKNPILGLRWTLGFAEAGTQVATGKPWERRRL
ncbi:MAG: hypothetical protein R6V05_06020 [Candidatus Brocadiia bacterium]